MWLRGKLHWLRINPWLIKMYFNDKGCTILIKIKPLWLRSVFLKKKKNCEWYSFVTMNVLSDGWSTGGQTKSERFLNGLHGGLILFLSHCRMLEDIPIMKKLFPFGKKSPQEMRQDVSFSSHSYEVLKALDSIVKVIVYPDILERSFEHIATIHVKHKITSHHFKVQLTSCRIHIVTLKI